MARKKTTVVIQNEPWESKKPSHQKFTKICNDMIESMAWQKLGLEAQGLYVFLKSKYTKSGDKDNALDIHITNKDMRILGKSRNTICKYLDRLIDNGFIKVVQHGRLARTYNVYGFTDEWKLYNTKDFFIHPNNKRLTDINSSVNN